MISHIHGDTESLPKEFLLPNVFRLWVRSNGKN